MGRTVEHVASITTTIGRNGPQRAPLRRGFAFRAGYNAEVVSKLDARTTRVRIIAGAMGVDIRWDQVIEIAEHIDLAEPVEKVRADVVAALKRHGLLADDQ